METGTERERERERETQRHRERDRQIDRGADEKNKRYSILNIPKDDNITYMYYKNDRNTCMRFRKQQQKKKKRIIFLS